MKSLVLLLFLSKANIVVHSWTDLEFPCALLQPDLEAIEHYFNHIANNVNAYVYWPNGISLLVHQNNVQNKAYLNITGTFKISAEQSFSLRSHTYNSLYYKEKQFHIMKRKTSKLQLISEETLVSYTQPKLPKQEDNYLSIRYFGSDEIKEMIKPLYQKYHFHMENVFKKSPACFLAIAPGTKHFIEYTLSGTSSLDMVHADGKLHALIGTEQKEQNKLILSKGVEANILELNQDSHDLTISGYKGNLNAVHVNAFRTYSCTFELGPIEHVFGIRMARRGILAEVKNSRVQMFNSEDLSRARRPTKHVVYTYDFLQKVKDVEPRYKYPEEFPLRVRPESTLFQIMGHILEKKVLKGFETRKDSPLAIKYLSEECHFLYGKLQVDQLYTNDSEVWARTDDGKMVHSPKEDITLMCSDLDQETTQ